MAGAILFKFGKGNCLTVPGRLIHCNPLHKRRQEMSEHSSVGKSLDWHVITILLNAKLGISPLSYTVIPSFCFTTFYRLDPYFIFKL